MHSNSYTGPRLKLFSQIRNRLLAIELLPANERSRIIFQDQASYVSLDSSFLSDLQCLTPLEHFGNVAA